MLPTYLHFCSFAALLLLVSCADGDKSTDYEESHSKENYHCQQIDTTIYELGYEIGEIDAEKMPELSGICSSTKEGLYWAINDKKNPPHLFLIESDGNIVATFRLPIELIDWEDICLSVDELGNTLVTISDTGNNKNQRKELGLISINESHLLELYEENNSIGLIDLEARAVVTTEIKLQDDLFDSEALMFNPLDKAFYLVSKRSENNKIYKLEMEDGYYTPVAIADIPYYLITAADISADGKQIVLKSYLNIFYWDNSNEKSLSELFNEKAACVNYSPEPKGEALAFVGNSYNLVTASEIKNGMTASSLIFYQRKD